MSTAGCSLWRPAAPRRTLGCSSRWLAAAIVAAALAGVCGLAASAAAQATTVEVTGAQRVFVRRGPGTGFPPFATIPKGTKVEIQDMQGEWARVTTSSGQVGYINSTFLTPVEAAGAVATAGQATGPTPVPTEGPPLTGLAARNQSLEAEVRQLRAELADLRNRPAATPAPTATVAAATPATDAELQQMHTELARLTKAVQDLGRNLNARPVASAEPAPPATDVLDGAPHGVAPAAVLLGVVGLLVGWLIGSSYGRKQERGRRSRIRF